MANSAGSRSQANGVLPVTSSPGVGNTTRANAPKPQSPRRKVIVRRLAPGLTENEFTTILGAEWRVGGGRVDWFSFAPGKVSKDIAKPSRPTRAYLHLTGDEDVARLAECITKTTFEDAQNTFTSSVLLGPPVLEFAPYGRIPTGKRRKDARAGTIDQDPELMAFLEGLANPDLVKELPADSTASTAPPEKITITPLVQYLKDKKANKSKEAAAKAAKKAEAKSKGKENVIAAEDGKKRPKETKASPQVEKAAREAVKILNREAASKMAADSAAVESPTGAKIDAGDAVNPRKAAMAAHARLVQRDLGLGPRQTPRPSKGKDTAKDVSPASGKKKAEQTQIVPSKASEQETTSVTSQNASTPSKRGKGKTSGNTETALPPNTPTPRPNSPKPPVQVLKKTSSPTATPSPVKAARSSTSAQKAKATPTSNTTPSPKPQPAQQASPGGATSDPKSRKASAAVKVPNNTRYAFIKHANASQGITEPLLKTALEAFGPVSMVDIDKRKGFAYVDFADEEGLGKAMAASPVTVAQGAVTVLLRRSTASSAAPSSATEPSEVGSSTTNGKPNMPRGRVQSANHGGSSRGGRGGSMRRGGRAAPSPRPPLPVSEASTGGKTPKVEKAATTDGPK